MASAPGVRLVDPGAIPVGATFRTGLALTVAAGGPVVPACVEVVFDPRMVYCVALEPPPPGGPPISHSVTIALGRVVARVTPADPNWRSGATREVVVATVQWRCVGEGVTRIETRLLEPEVLPPSYLLVTQRPRA